MKTVLILFFGSGESSAYNNSLLSFEDYFFYIYSWLEWWVFGVCEYDWLSLLNWVNLEFMTVFNFISIGWDFDNRSCRLIFSSDYY